MCTLAPQALCLSSVSFSVCLLFLTYDLVTIKHSFPPVPSNYSLVCHGVKHLGAYTSTPLLKVLFHSWSCLGCHHTIQLWVVGPSFLPDCAATPSPFPPFLPQTEQPSPSLPPGCGLAANAWDVCVNMHDSECLCFLCMSY